jgi:glycosyltransferase involved in cell wall biosynthesis
MWVRLGGQRQRYAPLGAGAEDGDFWTRAVSYGFGAKYVHPGNNGFFIYSWQSGIVSGNPNYREVDYRAWSPWTRNYGLMPTPSVATPKFHSHAARQYDEPSISVVIPVGPGHTRHLVNCLDSLDAQTYKRWEAIVVFDISRQEYDTLYDSGFINYVAKTWPFCRFADTTGRKGVRGDMLDVLELELAGQPASVLTGMWLEGDHGKGAGIARNIGIEMARAPLLLFLDADDWLVPTAMEKMVTEYRKTGDIIYTDHMAVANIPKDKLDQVDGNVVAYNEVKEEAYIHQGIGEYNCQKASEQPYTDGRPPYVICNVTSLVPTKWVRELGGFNTDINSWEDVLLFWMLAWRGKCFTRIPEPLLVYRYQTGSRREKGRKNAKVLLKYLSELAEKEKREGRIMGCGCSGGGAGPVVYEAASFSGGDDDSMVDLSLSRGGTLRVSDDDVVLAEFNPPDKGGKMRFGAHQWQGGLIKYGHFGGGEVFYVHVKDIDADAAIAAAQGRAPMFVPVQATAPAVAKELGEVVELEPPPEISEENTHIPDDYKETLVKLGGWPDVPAINEEPTSPEDYFPEANEIVQPPGEILLADLHYENLKAPHRALAKLAEEGIRTATDVMEWEEQEDDGIGSIKGIGPKAQESIVNASRKALGI